MSIRITLAAVALGLVATSPANATWWKPKPKPPVTSSSSSGGATPVPAPAGVGLFALGLAGMAIGRKGFRRRG